MRHMHDYFHCLSSSCTKVVGATSSDRFLVDPLSLLPAVVNFVFSAVLHAFGGLNQQLSS